jgi:hypothetical protein
MKLLQWFDTGEVDQLVHAIVTELVKRIPPSALDSHDRKTAVRLRNTHDAIFARAGKFARERTLNIYKKAHLGNRFRWALKEAGYPPEFIESWTYELVTMIAMNLSARK